MSMLCAILCVVAQESIDNYLKEEGMESHAYQRFEQLLKVVMGIADNYVDSSDAFTKSPQKRSTFMEEENAALRKVSAALNGHMTRLAERIFLISKTSEDISDGIEVSTRPSLHSPRVEAIYVRYVISRSSVYRLLLWHISDTIVRLALHVSLICFLCFDANLIQCILLSLAI